MKIKLFLTLLLGLCIGLSSCSSSSEEEKSSKEEDLTAVVFIQKEGIEVELSTENIPSGKGLGDTIVLVHAVYSGDGTVALRKEWEVFNSPLSLRDTLLFDRNWLYFYRNAVIKSMNY